MAGPEGTGAEATGEMRSLALTPTWSVATVLTLLVASSLIIERSIHRLSNWLNKTHRNPLYKAMEKMKEEMMLLGFISLLLAATSRIISGICIDSKYYNSKFSPCSEKEVEESMSAEHDLARKRNHVVDAILHHSLRRNLKAQYLHFQTCPQGYESFVSHEGLEQLHRFIFVMAVTHVTYSCLTMLLAILKVHTWRKWEDEAFRDNHESFSQIAYASATRRQPPALTKSYSFRFWSQNNAVMWLFCFLAQFGQSVVRADYLILRKGFIMNHNLAPTYDFHNYMIRSMEEEFEKIVGVSGVLWGFVIAFMLFNIDRSNLYFWIAILPVTLVLLVGAKLQHIIATLTSEGARLTSYGPRIKLRDDLFWFKKPKFLLWLIHFVLFQNAFELASFFWFWWQFGYESCFIRNHLLVYCRLVLGFAGQFLCSYSTLPVYALVTQMGSKYKAALIPYRIRETMHGWGKAARKRRKKRRGDDSTIRTETSTVCSLDYEDEDDDDNGHSEDATPPRLPPYLKIELRPMHGGSAIPRPGTPSHHLPTGMLAGSSSTPRGSSSQHALLQRQASASASAPSSPPRSSHGRGVTRSASMPGIASLVTTTSGAGTPARLSESDAHS